MPAEHEGAAGVKAEMDQGWVEQRLKMALTTKEKGNTAFKANDWNGAAQLYDKACKLCKGNADVPQVRTVLLACLTNRALTLSKLEQHKDVITTCTDALGLDPDNDKALFRRGVARTKLGMLDHAEADLNKMLQINPKSSDAKNALKECMRLRKQGVGKSPKSRPFEGMFNRQSPDKQQQLVNRFSDLSCEDANGGGSLRVCPYGGLKNEGATCYLNSVLQTIFHLPIFRRAVYSIPTTPARPGEKISVALALQRLFCRLQSPSSRSKAVSGVELLASFGWDSNDMLMQQDVGEFVNIFFDRIEASMKRVPELKDTITDLFGLKIACIDTIAKPESEAEKAWIRFRDDPPIYPFFINEIREYDSICAVCEFKAEPEELTGVNTSSDYEDAEKAIAKAKEEADETKLAAAEEELKRVLESKSGKGFGYKDLARRSLFGKMPPILMVNLTRIGYCPIRGISIKINSRFEFEEELDLTTYCREGTYDGDSPPKYRLFSVIVHSGFSQVGHYYCFLRPKMGSGDNQWYKFDDDAVWPCTREEAIHANYGEDAGIGRMRSAYFLVYIRESEVNKVLDTEGLSESIPKHVVESMGDEGLTTLPQALCVLLPRGRGPLVSKGASGASKQKGKGKAKNDEVDDGPRLRGAVVQVAIPDMQNCSVEALVALVKQACADAQHPGIEPPSTEDWYGGFAPPLYEKFIDEDGEESVRAVLSGDGDTEAEPELKLCLTLLRNYEITSMLDSASSLPLSKLNLNMAMRLEWADLSHAAYYTRVAHVMLLPGGGSRRHGDPFLLNAHYGEPVLTIKRRLCVTMGWDWEDVSQWEFYWLSNRPDESGQWEVTDDEPLVDTHQDFVLRSCQLVVVHPASEDSPLARDFWAPSILNKQNEALGIRIQSESDAPDVRP